MHRARVVFQVSNKVCSNERFASWLLNKPQTAAVTVNAFRLKSSTAAEPFLNGSSSAYVETMYNNWLTDPNSVHASWDAFFRNATNGAAPGAAYTSPPNLAPYNRNEVPLTSLVPSGGMPSISAGSPINEKIIDDHLAVQAIIRSYQSRGHLVAQLDPLGIATGDPVSSCDWHGGMRAFANEAVIRQHVRFGMNHEVTKTLSGLFATLPERNLSWNRKTFYKSSIYSSSHLWMESILVLWVLLVTTEYQRRGTTYPTDVKANFWSNFNYLMLGITLACQINVFFYLIWYRKYLPKEYQNVPNDTETT